MIADLAHRGLVKRLLADNMLMPRLLKVLDSSTACLCSNEHLSIDHVEANDLLVCNALIAIVV